MREKINDCIRVAHQTWFTWVLELVIAAPFIIESQHLTLQDLHLTSKIHPLYSKLKLLAVNLSKKKNHQIEYWKQLTTSFVHYGHQRHNRSTYQYLINGTSFAVLMGVLMQWKGYVAALRNHVANSLLDANIINIKYHAIWDINIVLIFLMNRSTENDMNYTRKLVCQFMLLSGTLGNTTVTFRDHQYVSDKPRM